jgi:ATP-dependent RNA helicase SUPV3L1/SUV3
VLYRTAGYRICGERAVRVDILERLADLIRPALSWRADATGTKPPGAIDGFAFTVTVGMTSLAGCSGEDFASVLRSLGYRMEKRAKPVEPPPASPVSASRGLDVSADEQREEAASMAIAHAAELMAEPQMEVKTPDALIVEQAVQSASMVEGEPPEPAGRSLPGLTAQEMINVAEVPTLAASEEYGAESPHQSAAITGKMEIATTELIEAWRPIRREEQRSQRREQAPRRRRPRRPATAVSPASGGEAVTSAADALPPASTAPEPSSGAEASTLPKDREKAPRHHGRSARRERGEGSDELRSPRAGRPDQRMEHSNRVGRPQHRERPGRAPRADRPDHDPALRAKYIKGRGEGSAAPERGPDPDSPFAKLAKLKEQLEAGAKEPR